MVNKHWVSELVYIRFDTFTDPPPAGFISWWHQVLQLTWSQSKGQHILKCLEPLPERVLKNTKCSWYKRSWGHLIKTVPSYGSIWTGCFKEKSVMVLKWDIWPHGGAAVKLRIKLLRYLTLEWNIGLDIGQCLSSFYCLYSKCKSLIWSHSCLQYTFILLEKYKY